MKRTIGILAMLCLAASAARAQSDEVLRKQIDLKKAELQSLANSLQDFTVKPLVIGGAVMGPAVKNAPYSAVEVTETTQVLGDGTRIHRETQTTVYRDSEGRVRRETPDRITIWDPVANTSYTLDPREKIARKLPLGLEFRVQSGGGWYASVTGPASGGPPPLVSEPPRGERGARGQVTVRSGARAGGARVPGLRAGSKTESLGKELVEGVPSDGTRITSNIETGAIGNDRPIQITTESWYSSELQTQIKSVHSDPRTGEEVFRLSNVSRVEPPSNLFQVPADYEMIERK